MKEEKTKYEKVPEHLKQIAVEGFITVIGKEIIDFCKANEIENFIEGKIIDRKNNNSYQLTFKKL